MKVFYKQMLNPTLEAATIYNKKLLATGDREQNTFQGICSHFTFYMSIHTDTRDWKKGQTLAALYF